MVVEENEIKTIFVSQVSSFPHASLSRLGGLPSALCPLHRVFIIVGYFIHTYVCIFIYLRTYVCMSAIEPYVSRVHACVRIIRIV